MSWDLADVTASLGTLHVGPRHQDQLFTKELVDYKKDVAEKCSFLDFIIGDNEEDKIEDWSGMVPSQCWVDNGISNVRVFPSPSIKKEWDDACKTADVKKSALKQKFEELAAK